MNTSVRPSSMRTGMLTTRARLGWLMRSRTPLSTSMTSATASSWRQAIWKVGELSKTGMGVWGWSWWLVVTTLALTVAMLVPLSKRERVTDRCLAVDILARARRKGNRGLARHAPFPIHAPGSLVPARSASAMAPPVPSLALRAGTRLPRGDSLTGFTWGARHGPYRAVLD